MIIPKSIAVKRRERDMLAKKQFLRVMYHNMGKPELSMKVLDWSHDKVAARVYAVKGPKA